MNALLLSAGPGTRLQPLTGNMPKCLLPVLKGASLLGYWIDILIRSGVDKIFINCFWHKEKIAAYVEALPEDSRRHVVLYMEERLEPTGMVLGRLKEKLGNKFLVINSDTYIEPDAVVRFIASAWVNEEFPVCLGYSTLRDVGGKSALGIGANNIVEFFIEKPAPGAGFCWAGIMLASRACLDEYAPRELAQKELTADIVPAFAGRMCALDVGQVIDIGGSLRDYDRARIMLEARA